MSDNIPAPSDPNLDFEKFKYKIELFKWLIVSVGLVITTIIIDWGFRDRASGLQEVQQYDKYATELLILNDNPKSKRMLAQYFSKVIPSEKLRGGWASYYKEVDKEYKDFLRSDSLAKIEIDSLRKDTSEQSTKTKILELENQVKNNERIIDQPLVLPSTINPLTPTVYIQIAREEQRVTANLLASKIIDFGYKAPGVELIEGIRSSNEIRYFKEADINAVKTLQQFLNGQNISTNIKFIPSFGSRTKQGTIEVWLK